MTKAALVIILTTCIATISYAQQNMDDWQFKQSPISTKWAAKVDPKNPLPEYPRPQMVRPNWQSLNGIWEFQSGNENDLLPAGKTLDSKILVPYPVESALSGVMKHSDRLWYRKQFSVPANWHGKRIKLNFGAVDWEAEIYINGKSLGIHKGGYDAFSYDITPYLTKGHQELIVRVFDPTETYGQPRGKQSNFPGGIMYTPTTGIWQSVWLEPVSAISIVNLRLVPDVDGKRLKVTVNASAKANNLTVTLKAKNGATIVSSLNGKANTEIYLPIANAKLWSPDSPFLYDLDITLKNGAVVTDHVGSYFGMRKIAIVDDGGFKKMYLNGKFLYQMGMLDQGFWPDGIYTAPTDEALKSDIEQTKNLGFNLIRKHIKVEPLRWYYWADKLGVLVWQDMPSVNSYLPQTAVRPAIDEPEFQSELNRMIEGHWNSPAIIMWVLFNEAQGQHDTENLVHFIKDKDPSRLVNQASGNNYFGVGDVIDRHSYPPPNYPESKNNTQAIVIGEFGGIGYAIKDHTWAKKANGYTNVTNTTDFIYLYAEFVERLKGFIKDHGLSASIYTQTTDVETETNGMMTYDRLLKADAADIRRINNFQFPKPEYKAVLPTSENEPLSWKYTLNKPGGNWKQADYDATVWSDGKGGFGKIRDLGHTEWKTGDIWLRKTFNPGNLTPEQIKNLMIRILHDDDVEVFINGVPAFIEHDFRGDYENRSLLPLAREAIKPNADNIIAIHCHQKTGGQFIDAGLYLRIATKP